MQIDDGPQAVTVTSLTLDPAADQPTAIDDEVREDCDVSRLQPPLCVCGQRMISPLDDELNTRSGKERRDIANIAILGLPYVIEFTRHRKDVRTSGWNENVSGNLIDSIR